MAWVVFLIKYGTGEEIVRNFYSKPIYTKYLDQVVRFLNIDEESPHFSTGLKHYLFCRIKDKEDVCFFLKEKEHNIIAICSRGKKITVSDKDFKGLIEISNLDFKVDETVRVKLGPFAHTDAIIREINPLTFQLLLEFNLSDRDKFVYIVSINEVEKIDE